MNNHTALGLPLELEDEQGLTISPLNALVIAEGIDSEGDTIYLVVHSEGMTSVQALGFANYAKLHAESEILRSSLVFSSNESSSQE